MTVAGGTHAPAVETHRRWGFGRIAAAVIAFALGGMLLAFVAYGVITTPNAVPGRSPLTAFDAEAVGHLEQEACIHSGYTPA